MLVKFDMEMSNRVSQIISGDEAWIYSYEPKMKAQSQVWVFPDESAPTKVVCGRGPGNRWLLLFMALPLFLNCISSMDDKKDEPYYS